MKRDETVLRQVSTVIVDDEPDCISLVMRYLDGDTRIRVIGTISDSSRAIEQILILKPELILLDIEMPSVSGIEILHFLNQTQIKPFVIFITSFEKYTIEALREAAFDYLLKPISKSELALAIERFMIKFHSKEAEVNYSSLLSILSQKKIKFNTTGGFILIDPDDIIYIQADYNYSEIYLYNKKREIVVTNIGALENVLPKDFTRINRSVIINLRYLEKVLRGKRLCYLKKGNDSYTFNIPARRIRDLEERL